MKTQKIKADEKGQIAGLKASAEYLLIESAGVQVDDHPVAGGAPGTQRHVISFTATENLSGENITGSSPAAQAAPLASPKTATLGQGTDTDSTKTAKPAAK